MLAFARREFFLVEYPEVITRRQQKTLTPSMHEMKPEHCGVAEVRRE